ncbi:hypothetical protein Cfor_10910 [Coptotermes formosanus]|uniref:Protein FAM177A1 n=1 Tax=Coptotermes formosanus TaxID=36987 RepID=A0A6L2PR00_COPFO|nr:hypothetical protein Cfor_10910 [Coptotermes formosanus]
MESGDCGNSNNMQVTSISDPNSEALPNTQPHKETEDKSCKISLQHEKVPRRIIHFSDGTIEEYSSDEDEPDESTQVTSINPSTLRWGPWIWYHTVNAGIKSLKVCDYLGEHLASFLGITTPKYQYEIDEYDRMMAEEEERKKKQDMELGGWTETQAETNGAVESPPIQQTDMTYPTVQADAEVAVNKF